jgi:hypothetical protein
VGRDRAAGRRARSRDRGRAIAWTLVLLALVAVAGVAAWLASDRWGGSTPVAPAPPAVETATAPVERRTLVETERLDGSLEFPDPRPVVGHLPGTVTGLVPEGTVVDLGDVLYRVDERPVTVLRGSVPAFRKLELGVRRGLDVLALEQSLVDLGFDEDREMAVDTRFTQATEDVVERWQEEIGAKKDGIVDLGEVVFLPNPERVGEQLVDVGAVVQVGMPILETTGTERVVSLDLPADRQSLAAVGDEVEIELPGGERAAGRITEIGQVAVAPLLADGTRGEPVLEVTIEPDASVTTGLDRAPVDVFLTKEARADVTAVPVTALLALKGGGYAVEVVDGTTTKLVAVEPGLYADGYVEVTGSGLDEGGHVVVPK